MWLKYTIHNVYSVWVILEYEIATSQGLVIF
jgi:hypothetical protein